MLGLHQCSLSVDTPLVVELNFSSDKDTESNCTQIYRVAVPSVAFERGAIASSRVKPVCCYKCRVPSSEPTAPHKITQGLNPSILCREFVLSRSSFRAQGVMDERHCSSEKNQPHQPQGDSALESDACLTGLSEKEIERRRKIGAANKGKAPWTKGRKLSIGMYDHACSGREFLFLPW